MNELITISCPSCGGQLRREAHTTTYICDYCGQQHRLRVEDIEEFGRCPVCHRNDKVEIVRAIYNKGGNLAARLAPPISPDKILEYRPKSKPAIEYSQEKEIPERAVLFYILPAVSLIIFVPLAMKNVWVLLVCLILAVWGLVYAVVLHLQQKVKEGRNWQAQNEILVKEWSQYMENYDRDYKKRYASLEENYQISKRRFENLYYCHRDDIVFIPGESGNAPSAKLKEFLYKE